MDTSDTLPETPASSAFHSEDDDVTMDTDKSSLAPVEVARNLADETNSNIVTVNVEGEKKIFMRVRRRKNDPKVDHYRRKFEKILRLYSHYAGQNDKFRNHIMSVQDEIERLMRIKRNLCSRLSLYNDNYMDQDLMIPDNNNRDANVTQLIDDVITSTESSGLPAKKKKVDKKKPRETAPEQDEPEAYEAIKNILNAATTVIKQQQQEQEDMMRRQQFEQKKPESSRSKSKPKSQSTTTSKHNTFHSTQDVLGHTYPSQNVSTIPESTAYLPYNANTQSQFFVQTSSSNANLKFSSPPLNHPFSVSNQSNPIVSTQSDDVFTQVETSSASVDTKVRHNDHGHISAASIQAVFDSQRKKISAEQYVPPRIPPQKNVHIETFPTTNRGTVQQSQPRVILHRIQSTDNTGNQPQQQEQIIMQPQFVQLGNNMQTVAVSQIPTSSVLQSQTTVQMGQPSQTYVKQSNAPVHTQVNNVLSSQPQTTQSQGNTNQQSFNQDPEPVKVYYNTMSADVYPQHDSMHGHQQSYGYQNQQISDAHISSDEIRYGDLRVKNDAQQQLFQVMQPPQMAQSVPPPVRAQPRLREALQNAGNDRSASGPVQQVVSQAVPLSMQHLPNVHQAVPSKSPNKNSNKHQLMPPIQQTVQMPQQHLQQSQVVQLNQINPNNNVIYIDQSRCIRVASSNGNINQYVIPAESVMQDLPYSMNSQNGYNGSNVRYIIPQQPIQQQVVTQVPSSSKTTRNFKDSVKVNQPIDDDNIDWSVYTEPKPRPPKKSTSNRKRTTAIKNDSNSEAMARISPILAKFQQEMAESTLAQEQQHQQQLTMAARHAVKVIPARARKRPTKAEREAAAAAKATQQQRQYIVNQATNAVDSVSATLGLPVSPEKNSTSARPYASQISNQILHLDSPVISTGMTTLSPNVNINPLNNPTPLPSVILSSTTPKKIEFEPLNSGL